MAIISSSFNKQY